MQQLLDGGTKLERDHEGQPEAGGQGEGSVWVRAESGFGEQIYLDGNHVLLTRMDLTCISANPAKKTGEPGVKSSRPHGRSERECPSVIS